MDDHDQRFKELLHEFLAEFLRLFFPDWAARLELTRPEWLEQELFTDPPLGGKVEADLVARVPSREAVPVVGRGAGDHWLVLIHVEVESRDTSEPIKPRMFEFYHTLRRRHGLPVLPLVLFLNVGRDGLGWDAYEERLWGRALLRYEYPYIGLPALDGLAYHGGENLLGVALSALMRLPKDRQAELKAEALRRVNRAASSEARRLLLADCLEAYFPLDGGQADEYRRLLQTEPYREVAQMHTVFDERVYRKVVTAQLEKRFGPLPEAVRQKLQTLPYQRLAEMSLELLEANSLKDLGLDGAEVT